MTAADLTREHQIAWLEHQIRDWGTCIGGPGYTETMQRAILKSLRSPAMPDGCVARESEEEAREVLAGRLIDAWCHDKGKKIPWAKAVQIIAIVTKQSDEERDRLLRLGDEGGACGMCGRTDQLSAGPPTADQPGEQTDHDCVPKPGIHK